MSDLDKAREWADSVSAGPATDRAHAAAKVIQSLPDHIIDAEKLREVVDQYEGIDAISVIIQDFADLLTPKSSIKPEDVPPNEPWLIEVDGQKAIGARYAGDSAWPWTVAALNGLYAGDYSDNAVTLIHKLVPETHTLPEGMRLADSKEYGRVVVSPKVDEDGDYKIFYLDKEYKEGATYEYAHPNGLTFLDDHEADN